jgi:hypothetical protein
MINERITEGSCRGPGHKNVHGDRKFTDLYILTDDQSLMWLMWLMRDDVWLMVWLDVVDDVVYDVNADTRSTCPKI